MPPAEDAPRFACRRPTETARKKVRKARPATVRTHDDTQRQDGPTKLDTSNLHREVHTIGGLAAFFDASRERTLSGFAGELRSQLSQRTTKSVHQIGCRAAHTGDAHSSEESGYLAVVPVTANDCVPLAV